jgi:hypothetical protein
MMRQHIQRFFKYLIVAIQLCVALNGTAYAQTFQSHQHRALHAQLANHHHDHEVAYHPEADHGHNTLDALHDNIDERSADHHHHHDGHLNLALLGLPAPLVMLGHAPRNPSQLPAMHSRDPRMQPRPPQAV